jgi:hypothetical protein
MSNVLKGMTAGFVATLFLSGLMVLNGMMDLMPQINIIGLLMNLGTLSTPAAWMDHFIVGVVVWGLLFAVYDSVVTRPAYWLKGIIFGVFAWLMMMVAFMPLAGAGFFGAKIGIAALIGLLMLHLIYGFVLGATYGVLGVLVPVRVPGSSPAEKAAATDTFVLPERAADYSFNDDLPTSSPSGKTVLIIFGILVGLMVFVVLVMEFRSELGF